ncbi:uncharacterized protein LOC118190073 [Stegodyphus dumicola]|uniref:uncharacterized protein LOC118190073 n=1 Tax=Stegodyphus dumicola TaxID=202533 RepID=UPI0015A8AE12|nr:uncharacterized protein LOC118190073 [Stegodyphus dumicola]
MSPFLINKHLLSSVGELKNIKRLRYGDLLIETVSGKQSNSLLKPTKLGQANVEVKPHITLNSSRGVVYHIDLVSEEEFVKELADQNVCGARRIKIRKDGQFIPTKHVILTLKSPNLTKNIKAGYLNSSVRPYIPNPMRCFQCQRFGHGKTSCRGSLTCARCSIVGHASEGCSAAPLCINCKGEHPAFSRSCPKWQIEKQIQNIKVIQKISFAQAKRLVLSNQISQDLINLMHLQQNHSYQYQCKPQ